MVVIPFSVVLPLPMPILSVSQVHHIVMDIATIVGLHTSGIMVNKLYSTSIESIAFAMIWL